MKGRMQKNEWGEKLKKKKYMKELIERKKERKKE